jgi:hypothetical protein
MPNVDDCITILAETMMRSRLGLVRLFAGYNAETYFQIGEMDSEIYFSRRDEIDFACGLDVPADPFVKVSQYTNRRYYGGAAMAHAVGYIGRVPVTNWASGKRVVMVLAISWGGQALSMPLMPNWRVHQNAFCAF